MLIFYHPLQLSSGVVSLLKLVQGIMVSALFRENLILRLYYSFFQAILFLALLYCGDFST